MSIREDGIVFWYSTLGLRDSHDFATRGYLRSLRHAEVTNIRVPPFSRVMTIDKDIEEFTGFMRAPENSRMKPLVRVRDGDPRIGGTWEVKSEGRSYKAPIVVGAVDLDVDQQLSSNSNLSVNMVLFHHDPSGICRHFMSLTGGGKPAGVSYGGITVWETSHVPDAVARMLSELDFLVVPSRFCEDLFKRSGVECEIVRIGHTFDPKQWPDPTIEEMTVHAGRPFVFYNIGTAIERKNHFGLMQAYLKEFKSHYDVVLRIKTNGETAYAELCKMRDALQDKLKIPQQEMPSIIIYHKDWPQEEMRKFHLEGDCFVSATRGEGFGLCEMEAKLCGRQVITTEFGAAKEILSGSDMLTKYESVNVEGMYNIGCYESDQTWADPDEEDLRIKMRHAYTFGPIRDNESWGRLHEELGPGETGKKLSALISKHQ